MELYNTKEIPLSTRLEKRKIQEKILRGEEITCLEIATLSMRDKVYTKLGDYECRPDCCYRAIDAATLKTYQQTGFITDEREGKKEYIEGENNAGINWYLGGACPKYGDIIIECPAYKEYFTVAFDNGCGMTSNIDVRHMKSSPKDNPIPISLITNIFDTKEITLEEEKKRSR